MTTPTPEQMRALADDLSYVTFTSDDDAVSRAITTLRAAADQLDAVKSLFSQEHIEDDRSDDDWNRGWKTGMRDVRNILAAAAPQEDRDD